MPASQLGFIALLSVAHFPFQTCEVVKGHIGQIQ